MCRNCIMGLSKDAIFSFGGNLGQNSFPKLSHSAIRHNTVSISRATSNDGQYNWPLHRTPIMVNERCLRGGTCTLAALRFPFRLASTEDVTIEFRCVFKLFGLAWTGKFYLFDVWNIPGIAWTGTSYRFIEFLFTTTFFPIVIGIRCSSTCLTCPTTLYHVTVSRHSVRPWRCACVLRWWMADCMTVTAHCAAIAVKMIKCQRLPPRSKMLP